MRWQLPRRRLLQTTAGIATVTAAGCTGSGGGPSPTVTDGLVGYWPLDGGTPVDESDNGNDGSIEGEVTTDASGRVGGAYEFTGIGNYVVVPDSSSLDVSRLTLSMWVYRSSDSHMYGNMFNRGNDDQWADAQYSFGLRAIEDDTNPPHGWNGGAVIDGEHTAIRGDESTFSNDEWHFLALTYDGSQLRLWHDDDGPIATADVPGSITTSDADALIGAGDVPGDQSENNNPDHFVGRIDDARLYNRALTEDELETVYSFGNSA
jgi:hypothetical protein